LYKVKSPEFLPALGLVIWGANEETTTTGGSFNKSVGDIFSKAKNIFQKIIPR